MKGKIKRTYIYLCIIVVLFAANFFINGCDSSGREDKTSKSSNVGKYVYIDSHGILHTRQCYLGLQVTDENGSSYLKPVTRIDTTEILPQYLKHTCSSCVEDEDFEILMEIAERNDYSNNVDW